ncbi:MAG: hypothetical protein QOD39_2273 [Mycobacterium sp.]|jgi:hypothetical protein|nr:hypothetical protein [Mycobacterium sp.]
MNTELERLLEAQGGLATSGQILSYISRRAFGNALNSGSLERIWQGVYCLGEPDDTVRLRGLDLTCGTKVAVCPNTAAGHCRGPRFDSAGRLAGRVADGE